VPTPELRRSPLRQLNDERPARGMTCAASSGEAPQLSSPAETGRPVAPRSAANASACRSWLVRDTSKHRSHSCVASSEQHEGEQECDGGPDEADGEPAPDTERERSGVFAEHAEHPSICRLG
jgi:hypothetical protein